MSRRLIFRFIVSLFVALLAITLTLAHLPSTANAAPRHGLIPHHAAFAPTPGPTPAGGLPDDATPLKVDTPLTESLDETTAIRFYKFDAKTGEVYRLSVEVKTGNFWTTTTVASADFSSVLGATEGDTLIDTSMRFAIPADTTYGVTVEYIPATIGTPVPGTYTITLSKVK